MAGKVTYTLDDEPAGMTYTLDDIPASAPSRDWSWRDAYKEPAKIVGQGAMGVLNTGVKAAKGIAGLGSLGKNLLQGKGLDASLAAATDTIGNRNAIADMGPQSKVLSALGDNIISPAVQKTATALHISPETLALGLEAGGDIATIVGLGGLPKTGLSTATSPLMKAKQAGVVNPVIRAADAAKDGLMHLTLKQPTKMTKAQRSQNIVTALEKGYRPTAKGTQKLYDDIDNLEATLDANFTLAQQRGVVGGFDKAINNIEALRESALSSSQPLQNLALIDDAIANLKNHPILQNNGPIQPGSMPTVGIRDLQRMKVAQGRELQNTYGELQNQFQNQIDKARVRGFKEEINDVMNQNGFNQLSDINSQLSKLYQLRKVLDPAANRIENVSQMGGLGYKAGVGGMLGTAMGADPALGAGLGTLIGLAQNPYVAPHVAQILHRVGKQRKPTITVDKPVTRTGLAGSGMLSNGLLSGSLRDTQN